MPLYRGKRSKLLLAALSLIAAWQTYERIHKARAPQTLPSAFPSPNVATPRPASSSDANLAQAYAQHRSGIQVQGAGTVARVLADDSQGSRHQRFLVRLQSGQTILIAHNIDLAARVEPLAAGQPIQFAGDYEWNERGGVVHWTHRDPSGQHPAGWIRYAGRQYQ